LVYELWCWWLGVAEYDGGYGNQTHRPHVGLNTLPTFPGILHASSTIPAFDDTEGALGGTSYHPCVADLRRKEERPRLALSYSRGMHKRILGLTKQSKVNLNQVL
jgi:hypothetical protein